MSLKSLVNLISKTEVTKELINRIEKKREVNFIGSSRYAKSIIIESIATSEKKDLLLICPNNEIAFKWIGYFESIENTKVFYYPPNEYLPYEERSKSSEVEYSQLNTINQLINKKNERKIIITTERALQPHLLDKELYVTNNLVLKKGQIIEIKNLVTKFSELGYEKENITSYEGKWSRRGDIVDIYPVNNESPVRIEFFDNVIDKIREYDPFNQKTLDTINEIGITKTGSYETILNQLKKLSESNNFEDESLKRKNLDRYLGLVENNLSNIISFINKDTILIFDEPDNCKRFTSSWVDASQINYENNKQEINKILRKNKINHEIEPNLHNESDQLYDQLKNYLKINLYEFENLKNKGNFFEIKDKPIKSPPKQFNKLALEINKSAEDKKKVWILSAQPKRTLTLLNENSCNAEYIENSYDLKKIEKAINNSIPVILKNKNNYEMEGFSLPIWNSILITDKELFGQQNLFNSVFIRRKKRSQSSKINLNKINPGDYIVHKNHGIGKFLKIEKNNITGESRDYLVIQYSDGKISVAADQLASIGKYRAAGNLKPKINKLGGTEWFKVKEKNKKAIKKVAIDLLKLYAHREKLKGFAYPPDGPWQRELEDSFPHQATSDQLNAVKDIKRDMENNKPMDRLICGDVGFGKTEVALRAIFKAITSGKQVILLAPTTILTQQHWRNISDRFAPYPIKVSLLNRFKTTLEKKDIISGLKNNNIDLIVATHQILSKNITFKNLGLLVIDEEQRFGVKQKEKIKSYKKNIDVLSLSATPIPRTLYMSLSGMRQMSLLNTPPPSRMSIKTYLSELDLDAIRTAISQEIDRGGQIFYVLPRITDIEQAVNKLKSMFQDLKFIVAHGQMNESDLENAMISFNNGEVDLMLCTTIIESGLDIPKVNTIIIEDAHKFGLSQLYQLRGRVGRSGIQAHAWLFYPNPKKLNEESKQRLKAIRDFSELGSGYQLAMKDMEIRGVGSVLGEKQSGQVNTIGYDLYMDMLHEAISDLNGREIPEVSDTQIDMPVNAFIPATWISDREEKLEAYKNVTSCINNDELTELASDWVNRYGIIPRAVETLIEVMKLKILAKKCGFEKIKTRKPNVEIDTRMKINTYNYIKQSLPINSQSKFLFKKDKEISKIIIRGLGVIDLEDQINNLIVWFTEISKKVEEIDKQNKL